MTTVYFLSDGVVLNQSVRKNNRTGYTYAALSPSWTLNADKPFIAACGNPSDPEVMKNVVAQLRTSLHLGSYADAREAAYVVGKYHQDPINTLRYINSNGVWDNFPADLYNLPEGLAFDKAVALLNSRLTKNNTRGTKVKQTISMDNRPARESFFSKYSQDVAKQLRTKFGSDMVRCEFDVLTINEFELRYGL